MQKGIGYLAIIKNGDEFLPCRMDGNGILKISDLPDKPFINATIFRTRKAATYCKAKTIRAAAEAMFIKIIPIQF